MTPDSLSSRELALLLIAHETSSGDAATANDDVTPVAGALRLATTELSNWVGPDGCSALLLRACTRASQDHPALSSITIVSHSAPVLTGIPESVQAYSAPAVRAGLTATLVELFELLGRVIGNDLTIRLAEQITTGGASEAHRREDKGI
ncbi:MAG: hypothetical protein WEE89_15265 [Gemmatimonadota bacterium]